MPSMNGGSKDYISNVNAFGEQLGKVLLFFSLARIQELQDFTIAFHAVMGFGALPGQVRRLIQSEGVDRGAYALVDPVPDSWKAIPPTGTSSPPSTITAEPVMNEA